MSSKQVRKYVTVIDKITQLKIGVESHIDWCNNKMQKENYDATNSL